MPKFIVDECTGIAVVHFLRSQGLDVVGVVEEMPQAADSDILLRAIAEQRVVVTNDKKRKLPSCIILASVCNSCRLPSLPPLPKSTNPKVGRWVVLRSIHDR